MPSQQSTNITAALIPPATASRATLKLWNVCVSMNDVEWVVAMIASWRST
jgi:hypothetical protein